MSTTQGIKLDDDTNARLKALAKKRNRSAHWLMKDAIASYLEREEIYEREKAEDMARWENYLLTGKSHDGTEVESLLKDLAENKAVKWPR